MKCKKCKHCKEKKGSLFGDGSDVQDSSTDRYLYRNKFICNECISDLMWEDYRVRTARDDKGDYL